MVMLTVGPALEFQAGTSSSSITVTLAPGQKTETTFEVRSGANAAQQGASGKGIPSFAVGEVNWTAVVTLLSEPGTDWFTISPTSGTATPDNPSLVTATVDATKLPGPGTYQAEIAVTSNPTVIVPVTVVVRPAGPRLSVSQTAILFQSVSSGPFTISETVTITNEGDGTLNWSLSGPPSWLTAEPDSGSVVSGPAGEDVVLTADPSSFGSGINSALLTVSAPEASNNPQVVAAVLLTVPGATPATAEVSPNALVFVAVQGQGVPPSQTVAVSNVGGGTLSFNFNATITSPSGGSWLTLAGQGGSRSGTIHCLGEPFRPAPRHISRNTDRYLHWRRATRGGGGVVCGASGECVAGAGAGSARRGPVRSDRAGVAGHDHRKWPEPAGFLSPGAHRAARVLTALVVDDCGTAVNNATLVASVEGLNIPLRTLGTGFYSGTWTPVSAADEVTVTFAALHPTLPKAQRSFTVETAAAPGDVSLPLLFADGVVEGAGFTKRRPLSPGGIISLFGASFATENNFASQLPLERELAKVRVRIGGQDAPLYFVGPGQINAQVPYEVSTGDSVPVATSVDGLLTAPQNYLIAAGQPGIFISGENAAILNASFQLVTPQNPVRAGDTIQIFATGLGAVQEQVETGAPAPSFSTVKLPVTVMIGGIDAAVVFQGLAPNFVELYQVNAVVPAGVAPGDAVPLVLTQNGIVANPDRSVTIPVQAP